MKRFLNKRLFEIVGYSLLALCFVQIGLLVCSQWISINGLDLSEVPIKPNAWSGSIIKTLAITLFCFLMKSVLQIMNDRSTESLPNAAIVMKWSVGCFVFSGVITILVPLWVWTHTEFLGVSAFTYVFDSPETFFVFLKSFMGFLSDGIKDILIALTIATLFTHFEQSIIFESEVA